MSTVSAEFRSLASQHRREKMQHLEKQIRLMHNERATRKDTGTSILDTNAALLSTSTSSKSDRTSHREESVSRTMSDREAKRYHLRKEVEELKARKSDRRARTSSLRHDEQSEVTRVQMLLSEVNEYSPRRTGSDGVTTSGRAYRSKVMIELEKDREEDVALRVEKLLAEEFPMPGQRERVLTKIATDCGMQVDSPRQPVKGSTRTEARSKVVVTPRTTVRAQVRSVSRPHVSPPPSVYAESLSSVTQKDTQSEQDVDDLSDEGDVEEVVSSEYGAQVLHEEIQSYPQQEEQVPEINSIAGNIMRQYYNDTDLDAAPPPDELLPSGASPSPPECMLVSCHSAHNKPSLKSHR